MIDKTSINHMRLWQLISPSLPVGAYAYSGGLESAVEHGYVTDLKQAENWISALLENALARLDVPVCKRLFKALQENDDVSFRYWNRYLLASRESAELLAEDRQLGRALKRLLLDLEDKVPEMAKLESPSYAAMFICAAYMWSIDLHDAVTGLLWSWCENQVAASIKLVPLGQTAGQQLLYTLQQRIPDCIERGLSIEDNDIGFTLPGLAILSAQHETQYSRLFRS